MGRCDSEAPDEFCDGRVRSDGTGVVFCNSNADCDATDCLGSCGTCSISEQRRCFLDPIEGSGTANPYAPKLLATACLTPSGSGAVNSAFGLPGPVRMSLETTVTYQQ
jgi:hypothetical protein